MVSRVEGFNPWSVDIRHFTTLAKAKLGLASLDTKTKKEIQALVNEVMKSLEKDPSVRLDRQSPEAKKLSKTIKRTLTQATEKSITKIARGLGVVPDFTTLTKSQTFRETVRVKLKDSSLEHVQNVLRLGATKAERGAVKQSRREIYREYKELRALNSQLFKGDRSTGTREQIQNFISRAVLLKQKFETLPASERATMKVSSQKIDRLLALPLQRRARGLEKLYDRIMQQDAQLRLADDSAEADVDNSELRKKLAGNVASFIKGLDSPLAKVYKDRHGNTPLQIVNRIATQRSFSIG